MSSLFSPPIDLSDLPNYQQAESRPRRSVFVGRVSTKDNQNPASSIPRQVALASERLLPDEKFIAYFWDVESGMLAPELRGLGPQEMYDALNVSVPRHGGLQDLLDRAEMLGVTHVVAERSDRVARIMLASLIVEHDLGQLGVEVVYANEPIGGTASGQLRSRRGAQVDAELFRVALMEMSMGGQIQHAAQGWNHGYPPYPYIALIDEDAPVRDKGRFGMGRPKKKLAPHPDGRRFATARELCRLRREEQLCSRDIIEILATDPEQYPIENRWTHQRVEGLIANPKLTGHQVYNRKAARTGRPGFSRLNPISEWVWSPTVVHEPVVSLEEWKTAQEVTAGLRADAEGDGPMLRIRAAARRLGFTVTLVRSSGTHSLYRIGHQQIVLPTPTPATIVQQIVADLESAR
ncbi:MULTISPECIES: recombinase family protein [unclassified Streptomyces]|uniref:recombinase family protein n=1 Tax=unclassified Streptomyces TaxID=2593676 RepID=UPI00224E2AF8|nr:MULTISPECIES: recombinase family protein [unclassified Streptomyces]MCX5103561.1 recombinase family protein [Streptomyces sp. NBC_00439]WSC32238.1 recombinase family protein [Streptomyces sp. NBC_01768]